MNAEELRAAASSASTKAPCDRLEFIKSSYQTATDAEIELIKNLAAKYDDMANNSYESGRIEPCIYNRGFYGVY